MRLRLLLVVLASALACRPAAVPPASPSSPSSPVPDERAPASWSNARLAVAAVPEVYVSAWRAAENRKHCALLAPARLSPDVEGEARPRAATFSGGWGVAYDLPSQRSAFGVAGTGASAWSGDVYDQWPERRVYADGSRVGYGPEGGTGPNWLAYVRIPGQDCLYNVWSRRGQADLERLLGELRFVAVE
ncbi:MAG TPA: hypothetical protein VF034_02945 [Gemmatimonadaceae bacterium]|jgi:hypothetical protein